MDEYARRTAVEYGVIAAIYMFLINSIINRILVMQDHGTVLISALLWLCSLLIVSLLLPYGIETRSAIKDIRSFAESSAISFGMLFLFFILLIGVGFLFFIGLKPSNVLILALTLSVPIILSSIIFYFASIWALKETPIVDGK